MARVDSQGHFREALGPLNARLVNGQYIVQTKGKKPKQTEETKKAASDFGYASKSCKIIRLAICEIIYKITTKTSLGDLLPQQGNFSNRTQNILQVNAPFLTQICKVL